MPCPDVVCVDTTMYAPGFPALLNQMPDVGVPLMTTLSQGDPGAEQYCLQILPKNGAGQTTPISNLQCYVVVETAN